MNLLNKNIHFSLSLVIELLNGNYFSTLMLLVLGGGLCFAHARLKGKKSLGNTGLDNYSRNLCSFQCSVIDLEVKKK